MAATIDTILEPIIWTGTGGSPVGKTSLGYFDSDPLFVSDAPKIASWCARRLGYPIVDIELADVNFYDCFEGAIAEYSSQVHAFTIRENMFNLMGTPLLGSQNYLNYTNRVVPANLTRVIQISDTYGAESGIGGNVTWKKGYINLQVGIQDYDLDALWGKDNEGGAPIEIKRVYHNEPVAFGFGLGGAMNYPGTDMAGGAAGMPVLQEFGWSGTVPGLATGLTYTIMPVYEDILRMQAVEFNNQIRKSGYGFEIRNNKFRIFPIPKSEFSVWFEYVLKSDKITGSAISGSSISQTLQTNITTNIGNAPYSYMQYSSINEPGRRWILKYTLASVKETLGGIRSKYSTIPIPGSEVTMNGDSLVQEGQSEKEALITQLREDLDRTGTTMQLQLQQEQSEHIQSILKSVAMPIVIG